jgi:hypothetical protein
MKMLESTPIHLLHVEDDPADADLVQDTLAEANDNPPSLKGTSQNGRYHPDPIP